MNEVIRLKPMAEVEEEAAAWIWRLDEENISDGQRSAFEDWLRRDVRHRRAFEQLGGVWKALDGLAEAKREEKIATFVADYGGGATASAQPWYRRGLTAGLWAMAASLVAAMGFILWMQRGTEAQTLATAVGQQRTAVLADGSTVYLNTNTILETHLSRQQRDIRLVKGEALFKVAADGRRPFAVAAGNVVVRALGTEFNIRMKSEKEIAVLVAEGRVRVESQSTTLTGRGTTGRTLTAGQRVETDAPTLPVVPVTTAAVSKTLAWREGAIVFEGEPLATAIDELNRYTDTRFVVTDPAIRDLAVGGRFRAGDVQGFLEALTNALPVTARRAGGNVVYIEPRTAP